MAEGRKPGSARAGRLSGSSPWWLAGGDESCAHCGQEYAYETEVRCIACDEPMCALCVVRYEARLLCPACVEEGGS